MFLSRSLLEPTIQALDNAAAVDGVAYIQGLANWSRTATEPVEITVAGIRVTLLRSGM